MDVFLVVLIAVTAAGYGIAFLLDPSLAGTGLRASYAMLIQSIVWIVVSILMAGLLEQVIEKKLIYFQIGRQRIWTEIGVGTLLGAFGTGSRWAVYPLAATLLKTGFSPAGVVAFISSWFLISLPRVGAEIPFLGTRFVVMRVLISLAASVVAGGLARLLWR